jgi:hypothetical protein
MKLKNDQLTGAVGDFVRMAALGNTDAEDLQRLACDLLGVPRPEKSSIIPHDPLDDEPDPDLGHVFPTDEHDRAWYEENDPQSLVDSLNGNVNCPHNALHKMRSDGLTFTAYRCGNCAMIFEVAEHKDTEPVIERLVSGPRSPWGTRLRQA